MQGHAYNYKADKPNKTYPYVELLVRVERSIELDRVELMGKINDLLEGKYSVSSSERVVPHSNEGDKILVMVINPKAPAKVEVPDELASALKALLAEGKSATEIAELLKTARPEAA